MKALNQRNGWRDRCLPQRVFLTLVIRSQRERDTIRFTERKSRLRREHQLTERKMNITAVATRIEDKRIMPEGEGDHLLMILAGST